MAVTTGSEAFGLWVVSVSWQGNAVYRVHLGRSGEEGPVHPLIHRYLSGQEVDFSGVASPTDDLDGVSGAIYRAVRGVGYGETATYGEIAAEVGTSPRAVGQAMARNPTPLVVPCHRIVSKNGIGGFTPPLEIKRDLLALERSVREGRKGRS
jgi:methylated-DNA-[protein]-cysteine S-methyltransferase